jgi:HlyD family secretion protein
MTEFEADLITNTSSIRSLMRWFIVSSVIVGGGVGGWAVAAKVDSAVVTTGTFVVQSSAQAVQHPEGGVVGAILVKDGELVRAGQVLVRLDAAKVIADTTILERKLIDLSAERARLDAERQDRATIQPPSLPVSLPDADVTLKRALAAQESIMSERRSTRSSQLSQLSERKTQIEMQVRGFGQRLKSLTEELAQASAELADFRMLEGKGLIRRPLLRQSERDVSRLRGEIGDTESRIAGARSQLIETEFKVAEITRNARSEVLRDLQAVTAKLAEIEEQRAAARDRLERLEIRAPRTGRVHELSTHTVGGVVGPGQKLMSIIPNTEPLLVSARIRPDEIDQVHVGQKATVRISSFKLPVVPELDGQVTSVSPDQVVDDNSGQAFFTVKIAIAPEEGSKLEGKELTAGLPAEVLIRGEARRVIAYLTQPLTEKVGLAFREK